MIKHYREIHKMLRSFKPARLAVVNPQQAYLQKIIAKSQYKGIIEPLVFLNEDPAVAAIEAVKAVVSGEADFLMKGDIDTAQFIQIVLNRDYRLRTDKLLSHVAVIETPFYNRPMLCSDGMINIKLNKETVPAIVENALSMASSLGIKNPMWLFYLW